MVRIYCLTSITKIDPTKNIVNVVPDDMITDKEAEKFPLNETYSWNLFNLPESAKFYQLTEICIGFTYSISAFSSNKTSEEKFDSKTLMYAINIFRNDIDLLCFKMTRGSIIFKSVTVNTFDLIIKTSQKFKHPSDFDLLIKVRCIKNTVVKGIISEEEKEYYENYANGISYIPDTEPNFKNFLLPKTTNSSALRTKISDIRALIKHICDPQNGSIHNIPIDKRYSQNLKCLLYERKQWRIKKYRKDGFELELKNMSICNKLCWEKVNFGNISLSELNIKEIEEIDFDSCQIVTSKKEFHQNFIKLNFSYLTKLMLHSCSLPKFSDEFVDLLPTSLTVIDLEHNDITFITSKILKFENLHTFSVSCNRRLGDNGFPWKYLPTKIKHFFIDKTNLKNIPSDIERLIGLNFLTVGGINLEHVSWKNISNTVQILWIFKAKHLNEIDLLDKTSLTQLQIINANIKEIDCSKLPQCLKELYIKKNKLENFDTKNALPNLYELHLKNNCLKTINWETLPKKLGYLFLDQNELTCIGNLTHINLEEISFSFNKVETITGNLGWVKGISAESNPISSITVTSPQEQKFIQFLFKMPLNDAILFRSLTWLNLEKCKMSFLPIGFEGLEKLKNLYLDYNNFDYQTSNLEQVLWNRLPKNLTKLILNGNKLHKLPCMLKDLNIEELSVENCDLSFICPYLYTQSRKENKFQHLIIIKNQNLKNLSFVPQKIYQPPNSKGGASEDTSKIQSLKITTDNLDFINTSKFKMHARKPIYEFKEFNGSSSIVCQCCSNCGKETDNNLIEQMMICDFALKIQKTTEKQPLNDNFYDDDIDGYKIQKTVNSQSLVLPNIYGSKEKTKIYLPGEWKSILVTRICQNCLIEMNKKIDDAYDIYAMKLADEAPITKKKVTSIPSLQIGSTITLPLPGFAQYQYNDPYGCSSNTHPIYLNIEQVNSNYTYQWNSTNEMGHVSQDQYNNSSDGITTMTQPTFVNAEVIQPMEWIDSEGIITDATHNGLFANPHVIQDQSLMEFSYHTNPSLPVSNNASIFQQHHNNTEPQQQYSQQWQSPNPLNSFFNLPSVQTVEFETHETPTTQMTNPSNFSMHPQHSSTQPIYVQQPIHTNPPFPVSNDASDLQQHQNNTEPQQQYSHQWQSQNPLNSFFNRPLPQTVQFETHETPATQMTNPSNFSMHPQHSSTQPIYVQQPIHTNPPFPVSNDASDLQQHQNNTEAPQQYSQQWQSPNPLNSFFNRPLPQTVETHETPTTQMTNPTYFSAFQQHSSTPTYSHEPIINQPNSTYTIEPYPQQSYDNLANDFLPQFEYYFDDQIFEQPQQSNQQQMNFEMMTVASDD